MASEKNDKENPEERQPDKNKIPIEDKSQSQKVEEPPQTEQDRLI